MQSSAIINSELGEIVHLKENSLQVIHAAILATDTLEKAAEDLTIEPTVLADYLSEINYIKRQLSYDFLKKDLTQAQALQYWGKSYTNNININLNFLYDMSLQELHFQVKNSSRRRTFAAKYAIPISVLKHHFKKITYKDEIFSYQKLQDLSIADAQAFWGVFYSRPVKFSQVINCTIEEIHQTVIESSVPIQAANYLGFSSETFAVSLNQVNYQNQNLTYEIFKTISKEIALAYWGDAYKRPLVKFIYLDHLTLESIYTEIFNSPNINEAARNLKVDVYVLTRHIRNFNFTYEKVKTITFDEFRQKKSQSTLTAPTSATPSLASVAPVLASEIKHNIEETKSYKKKKKKIFFGKTISEIHTIIKESADQSGAASKFNLSVSYLNDCLRKLVFNYSATNYVIMKWLSVDDAQGFWRAAYYQPLEKYIFLENVTVRAIHEAVIASDTINEAAASLSVDVYALIRHFANLSPLTFASVKAMRPKEAREFWGAAYYKPVKIDKIPLSEHSLQTIHDKIVEHTSILAAASFLGVSEKELIKYLTKFIYQDETLTFVNFKTINAEDIILIKSIDGQPRLDEPPQKAGTTSPVITTKKSPVVTTKASPLIGKRSGLSKYSLQQIHIKLRESEDINAAADALKVAVATLKEYLRIFYHHQAYVDFGFLQNLTPEDAEKYWGILYTNSISANNIAYGQKSLMEVHDVINNSKQLSIAIQRFGVTRYIFSNRLKNIFFKNVPLDFDVLKKEISKDEAREYWGDDYNKSLYELGGFLPGTLIQTDSPEPNADEIPQLPITFNDDNLAFSEMQRAMSSSEVFPHDNFPLETINRFIPTINLPTADVITWRTTGDDYLLTPPPLLNDDDENDQTQTDSLAQINMDEFSPLPVPLHLAYLSSDPITSFHLSTLEAMSDNDSLNRRQSLLIEPGMESDINYSSGLFTPTGSLQRTNSAMSVNSQEDYLQKLIAEAPPPISPTFFGHSYQIQSPPFLTRSESLTEKNAETGMQFSRSTS